MELHFISTGVDYLGDIHYKAANKDAKTALIMSGRDDGCISRTNLEQEGILKACSAWGFKVYVREANQPLSQAVCLNPKFEYLNCKSF